MELGPQDKLSQNQLQLPIDQLPTGLTPLPTKSTAILEGTHVNFSLGVSDGT